MPAYVVVEINIVDPTEYELVKKLTPPTVQQYGGIYLARGGFTETLEGDWEPKRLVVLQFPDLQAARDWWSSPEYAPVKAMRQKTAVTLMVLTEGNPILK